MTDVINHGAHLWLEGRELLTKIIKSGFRDIIYAKLKKEYLHQLNILIDIRITRNY